MFKSFCISWWEAVIAVDRGEREQQFNCNILHYTHTGASNEANHYAASIPYGRVLSVSYKGNWEDYKKKYGEDGHQDETGVPPETGEGENGMLAALNNPDCDFI